MAPPSEIERRASRVVYENPWLRVREDDVAYADGTPSIYSVVEKPDFVLVVPFAHDGFWLVEQYRYAVGRRTWEFPQGGWPAGRSGTQEQLARAELQEETGLRAERWTHLGRLFAAVGFADQSYDVFLATGLVQGPTDREATEQGMTHGWVHRDELHRMIRNGSFADGHSVAALTLLDLSPPSRP